MSLQKGASDAPRRYDCLLIDDEELLSEATCEYFQVYGIQVFWAQTADVALSFLEEHKVDIILLEINLKETTGFEVCKTLRLITDVPILFISARQSDDDRLLAFNVGGDDYVQKPYSLSVLHAKVKVVLARYRKSLAQRTKTLVLKTGELVLNDGEHDTKLNGQRVELRPMEYKLLRYLMQNPGRVISKEEIFEKVWEESITSENTLSVHIRRLREKLEKDADRPQLIKTVWGVGYVFNSNESEASA